MSDALSFHEEGERAVETEVARVVRDLRGASNLAGLAIHDEAGDRPLRP